MQNKIIIKVCCGGMEQEFIDPDDDMTIRELIDEANDVCAEFDKFDNVTADDMITVDEDIFIG